MPDSVYQQALLYACGELDADEVVDFETRLSGDQDAREALVAAVSMVAPSSPLFTGGPNPAYRARVRQRLFEKPLVARSGEQRGPRWAYAVGGAAAAVLAMVLLNPQRFNAPSAMAEAPAPTKTPHPALIPQAQPTAETIYSDLSNTERVFRVHDQRQQRRNRLDDLKLPHGMLETPAAESKGSSM